MEWWQFNGYGFYVWGSYLVALAVVGLESALLSIRRRNALQRFAEQEESA